MKSPASIAAAALACLAASLALAQAPRDTEGLVAVKAKNVDEAWLLPGADFRPYRKVLLKRAEVAFQKNWVRDMSQSTGSRVGPRVSDEEAMNIVETARTGFDEIWAVAFRKVGYEVVNAPGEGVLEVAPRVVDLYINALDRHTSSPSRTYTVQAGEATLHLDVRDSRTGTLLGRVADRRETMKTATPQMASSGRNASDFAQLFATWAVIAAKGLEELKANSPLPETLEPGKKVPKK
ncbi:MAG: DUF3313 domain-containing protein [Lysobacter sp.]|nr:DUF3313 domain-containing protein [Lysobacter sp.]